MILLPEGYVNSSCVIKTKKNDLLTMGTINKVRDTFIDISDTRNEFPEIAYQMPVKVEIYNSRLGFRVLIGSIYISSKKLIRIIDLKEATNEEHREYFRITVREEVFIYNQSTNLNYRDTDIQEGEAELGLTVELVDVSLGGILIKSKMELQTGSSFCIKLPSIGADNLYKCIVRRQVVFNNADVGVGCEFMDMSVLQEDLLYRFILKSQNTQLKRVR